LEHIDPDDHDLIIEQVDPSIHKTLRRSRPTLRNLG